MATEQYIVFRLNEGEYGINIMNIREIIPYKEATKLPDTPEFIEGIVNHRDKVIPIINLKSRLKLDGFQKTRDSRIIVITLDNRDVGFLVDEASQTIILKNEDIDKTPDYIGNIDKEYITGVGKLKDGKLLIIIDLEKILSYNELSELKRI